MSRLKISNRLLLALGSTFLIAAALIIFLVNHSMRKQALLKDPGLKSKPISATILRRS